MRTTDTHDPLEPVPLVTGAQSDATLTQSLLAPVYRPGGWIFWSLLAVCSGGVALLGVAIVITFERGIGAWGNDIPVAWAFAITNFVWWIGFGHAGTLISAILVLFEQRWRASVNRLAEGMTLFAVIQAGLFPLLHLGRPQYFFWLIPYPSRLRIWPQFRSSLTWDIAAVFTYFTVSLLFWYTGLVPDLAAARDRAPTRRKRLAYAIASLGWRGSSRHWNHWRTAYLLLAALATPLVISVHTIVSFDFAIAQLPGWHTTIFPPYFVAGAIFSGFALVLVLLIPARALLGFGHVVTAKHIDVMNRFLLATSLMVAYGYLQENFFAWYSADPFEAATFVHKRTGPYGWLWMVQIAFNVVLPQVLWWRRARSNLALTWGIAALVCVGMWVERFTIIVPSLAQDFLPANWHLYFPSWVDLSLLFGSMCFFGLLFLLFLKLVPFIPLSDVKHLHHELLEEAAADRSAAASGVPTPAAAGASKV
jgi:molybdopterin-containing oxidoreductase family membrane subunit